MVVGIEIIDQLRDAGRIEFHAKSVEEVLRTIADMRKDQEQRLAMRQMLAQPGADMMFDSVTLAALEDTAIPPVNAIEALRTSDIPIIDLDVRHGRMVLSVKDSVVAGNIPLGDGMCWQNNRLTVPKARALCLVDVTGKSLKSVVLHDYFAAELTVTYASELSDSTRVSVRRRPVAVRLGEVKKAA